MLPRLASSGRLRIRAAIPICIGAALAAPAAWGSWPRLTAKQRQFMPPAPYNTAAAVILYKQVDCNNPRSTEEHFVRIKILRHAGLNYATIKIPYLYQGMTIAGIAGRTIEPDGTIIPFRGKVRRTLIAAEGHARIDALEFNLPQVQVGSILDYRYNVGYNGGGSDDIGSMLETYTLLPTTTWNLQQDLWIRRERYSIMPTHGYTLQWIVTGLSAQQQLRQKGNFYLLSLRQIPPTPNEPKELPRAMIQKSVVFFYNLNTTRSPKSYWKNLGKKYAHQARQFAGNRKKLKAWLARWNLTGSREAKLRALYLHVLQIQNLNLNASVANPRPAKHALKVLRHGYASGSQLNLLLVALARAAGYKAYWVHSAQRNRMSFLSKWCNPNQLDNDMVMIRLHGKYLFFDPSSGAPFGDLLWWENGVIALIARHSGGKFIIIPNQSSRDATRFRHLDLTWEPDGGWAGGLQAKWTGTLALSLRMALIKDSQARRQQFLSRLARSWLPYGTQLALLSSQGWRTGANTITAQWQVQLPGRGTRAALLPQDVLNLGRAPLFSARQRTQAVYFHYMYRHHDEITLHLPRDAQVQAVPSVQIPNPPSRSAVDFSEQTSAEKMPTSVVVKVNRRLIIRLVVAPVQFYPTIKGFFDAVHQADHATLSLRMPLTEPAL